MIEFERAEFDRMPPERERDVWCAWLRRHSIDPNIVLVPGWIERRPTDYQVAYLSAEFAENGCMRWDRKRREPVYVIRIAQLEGPPLPFPDPVDDRDPPAHRGVDGGEDEQAGPDEPPGRPAHPDHRRIVAG